MNDNELTSAEGGVETSFDTDDLTAFEAYLYPKNSAEKPGDDPEATGEDDDEEVAGDDTPADNDQGEADESEADVADEPPAKPKSRFQERIDDLTAKTKHAEREAELAARETQELRRKLDEVLQKLNKPEPDVFQKVAEADGPQPTDLLDDGSDKYPLGEFDPAFIRDLTRHSFKVEREAEKAAEAEAAKNREIENAQTELQAEWSTKLQTAIQDKYPDMPEKNLVLRDEFAGLNPEYAQYLGNTIMSLECGPDVLYYLASNLPEARKIANSTPTAATLALGRLEAKFLAQADTETKPKPKPTKAPPPPANFNRGSSVNVEVPDDTDDLEAFDLKLRNMRAKHRW